MERNQVNFKFGYGKKIFCGLPSEWELGCPEIINGDKTVSRRAGATDPESGLLVTAETISYDDFPVTETTVWFENNSERDSLVLRRPELICSFALGGPVRLWHGFGECHDERNYSGAEIVLMPEQTQTFAPKGGRSCDEAFPYFRFNGALGGAVIAVGWPGQWHASFTLRNDKVMISAGQQTLETILHPGEKVRTPGFTVMQFQANDDPVNLWRRWFRNHVMPRDRDGGLLKPRLCGYARRHEDMEHCVETAESQINHFNECIAQGFACDTWWIDAGWYFPLARVKGKPGYEGLEKHWYHSGVWAPDPKRFPDGFAPLAEALAEENADLLLWFEPERVYNEEEFAGKPDNYLLSAPGAYLECRLLNLADRDCLNDLCERFDRFIADNRIGIYRQDFNIAPLPFWQAEDARQGKFRRGITENLYIQGYLAFFDHLLGKHPGLIIDNCASGGRRNDLESMRRAVPLHYSDYGYTDYMGKQRYHRTLHEWLLYFKDAAAFVSHPGETGGDAFESLSSLSPFHLVCVIREAGYDRSFDLKLAEISEKARRLMLDGDYYRLSKNETDGWTVNQFHDPALSEGAVLLIRNENSRLEEFPLNLKELSPHGKYEFQDALSGKFYRDKVRLCRRDATLIYYRRQKNGK
ncbi:MAG: alpha-galactosidase [Victivallales bacterium]|nr:alpha-galactosidase [Victivallales bacterium]